MVSGNADRESMEAEIVKSLKTYIEEGFETVAVICKTAEASYELYGKIRDLPGIKLIDAENSQIEKGAVIIPSYLAKGLEFDAVIVHDASDVNYCTELDRRLLYIACSRALHRLMLLYYGNKSRFI